MKRHIKALTTLKPKMWEHNVEADMIFTASPDITAKYGNVHAAGSPDPSKCYIMGVEAATVVGERSTITLQVLNFNNQPCKELVYSVTCELVSEIESTKRISSEWKQRVQDKLPVNH